VPIEIFKINLLPEKSYFCMCRFRIFVERMTTRFADIESFNQQEPINDYLRFALVSLAEAIVPISQLIPGIEHFVKNAQLASSAPADNLTPDESAAIYLYTMDSAFFENLNFVMRSNNENQMRPYSLYLKLFHTALAKLPCHVGVVWRGILSNVSSMYVKDKYVIWHGASSSSIDASVVTNFLDRNCQCTLFQIDCRQGKSINKHSAFPSENEIILMPGTKLLVKNKPLDFNGFQLVQLEELHNANLENLSNILYNSKKTVANGKELLKPPQPNLAIGSLYSTSLVSAMKKVAIKEAKIDNCE
jgi:hypothetical protein